MRTKKWNSSRAEKISLEERKNKLQKIPFGELGNNQSSYEASWPRCENSFSYESSYGGGIIMEIDIWWLQQVIH